MDLTTVGNFKPREAQKLTERIQDAKVLLEEQVNEVLETVREGIEKYNGLDKLVLEKEK